MSSLSSLFSGSSGSGLSDWKFQVYSARVFESCDDSAPTVEADGVTKHVEVQEMEIEDLLGPFRVKIILAYRPPVGTQRRHDIFRFTFCRSPQGCRSWEPSTCDDFLVLI